MATRIGEIWVTAGHIVTVSVDNTTEEMTVAMAYGAMIPSLKSEDVIGEELAENIDLYWGEFLLEQYPDYHPIILKSKDNALSKYLGKRVTLIASDGTNTSQSIGEFISANFMQDEGESFFLNIVLLKSED